LIKLLYITNGVNGSGGLERVLSIKASELADSYGYDVHIISLNQGGADLFYDFSPKIKFHNVSAKGHIIKSFFKFIKGYREVVKKINPDVIAVCDDGAKGFLQPLFLNKPCPMIYERHVSKLIVEPEKGMTTKKRITTNLRYALMNFGAKSFDAFVVLTKGNLKEWDLENLRVIPNPLSFYSEDSSLLQNKKVIAVGKHSFQKGYDRLLKSWKQVVKKHPDWILEIYGASNPDHNLKQLSIDLGIANYVEFYKPVKNIEEKFKEASIAVLSSRFEGFGMVLIEAMSCGLPVVSYDCPCGPSDIISDKEDGFLVENGEVDLFAERVIELIENEDKRINMGKAAKQNVKRFLPKNIVQQWHQLFTLLKQK